ncbi:MAG: hypothetical protein R3B84_06230 [Zavarzinella sp.]
MTWKGDPPVIVPELIPPRPYLAEQLLDIPPAFVPQIHENSGGLAGVVVYLEPDPQLNEIAGSFPPLTICSEKTSLRILQIGNPSTQVGLVRQGEEVSLTAFTALQESIRFRNADFFTLKLPTSHEVVPYRMNYPGRVEVTSGSGHFWSGASIYVTRHPFYTITNQTGNFELSGIPAGRYRLIAELSSWEIHNELLDPEYQTIYHRTWAAPFRKSADIDLGNQGKDATASFTFP